MSSMEVLRSIRQVEQQAEEIRKEAMEKARLIMRQGEDEARDFHGQVIQEAAEEGQKMMKAVEEEARGEIEVLNAKNQEECARIRAVAEKNFSRAVTFVLGRIVKNYGHH